MGGGAAGRTVPDLSNIDVSSEPAVSVHAEPRYLDDAVPGGREQPLLTPAHLADGVVVAHQGVLASAVRDRVEITEGTETRSSHSVPGPDVLSHSHVVVPGRTGHSFPLSQHQAGRQRLARRVRGQTGGRRAERDKLQLSTMLEKETLLWKSFMSLENIFRLESGTKTH